MVAYGRQLRRSLNPAAEDGTAMPRYGVRFENDPSLTPRDLQELGQLAEELGYETVWAPEGGGRDSLTALATIAMKTERVRLGHRNPARVRPHRHQYRDGSRRHGRCPPAGGSSWGWESDIGPRWRAGTAYRSASR